MEIPISVTAYNRNPYNFVYPLLRTMKIPVSVTAYNGNPLFQCCYNWIC